MFELRLILANGKHSGLTFLYHVQGYQRGKWIGGNLNIRSRKELNKVIRQWFDEMETEIKGDL